MFCIVAMYSRFLAKRLTQKCVYYLTYLNLVFVKCDTNYVWNKLNHENKKKVFFHKLETRQRQLLTRVYSFAVLL